MLKLLLIFLGAGAGGVLRYLIGAMVQERLGVYVKGFPWGTLTVNVSGCLAIGIVSGLAFGPESLRDELRAAAIIGVLGGYTTFSSFGLETVTMMNDGRAGQGVAYVLLSNLLSLGAVALGVWVGRR